MLVHRSTMGVLLDIWTGEHRWDPVAGENIPAMRPAKPGDVPDYDPAEWWEVPADTPLGRRILKYYPALTPVVGEGGELLDALPEQPEKPDPETAKLEARARGYKKRTRLRPKNLFDFMIPNPAKNEK